MRTPDARPSLTAAARVNARVIHALLMREVLTRYGRHNIGFLWLFVEPMIFTLGVTALWTSTKSVHGSDLPIVAFALTGYSSVLLWRNMPGRCIGALRPNLSLLFHSQVRVFDIYLARLVLEAIGATTSFLSLGIVLVATGLLAFPEDLLKVLAGWCLLAWLGGSLAVLLGALSERSELVEKLWHPFSYLLFPLSGAAFMVDALPQAIQEVVLLLPMVHGVEILREGYFGSQSRAHYDIAYATSWAIGLSLVGLMQVRTTARKVVPSD